MNLIFILAQNVGIIAWIILILSYYRKNTNKILAFHVIATLLYSIHYLMLEAYSGFLISLFTSIVNYGYYKSTKDKYIFYGSIPIYLLISFFTFKNFYDFLPVIAGLVDSYTLTKKKKTVIKGAIISYSLWVIYDIFVKSYSGVVTDGLLVISNTLILFFRRNVKRIIRKINKFF